MSDERTRAAAGRAADAPIAHDAALHERVALVDLVNRVMDRGVCVTGDVVVSVAGVDLLYVGLRVLLGSVDTFERASGLGERD